jgi:hypothetical protein
VHRRQALAYFTLAAAGGAREFHAQSGAIQQNCSPDANVAWVQEVLYRMLSIQVGMSRAALTKVFTTEGGAYLPMKRTYVSRDCRFFKVDVEFQAASGPIRDKVGRDITPESDGDLISKISTPYLQFSITD